MNLSSNFVLSLYDIFIHYKILYYHHLIYVDENFKRAQTSEQIFEVSIRKLIYTISTVCHNKKPYTIYWIANYFGILRMLILSLNIYFLIFSDFS